MPAVSIITPTYNRPDLLPEAIVSVLAQSFSDFEMIIVDDGSNPPVRPLVEHCADPRLRYFFQHNAGRSTARNHGLKAARGEFIAFLDDDDLYHPDKLDHEIAFMRAHPAIDIVSSGFRILDKNNETITISSPWKFKPIQNAENCLYSCPQIPSSVLLRRSALERLEPWFDQDYHLGEDTDFFTRLLLSGARFDWVREVLIDYRLFGHRDLTILIKSYSAYRQILTRIFQRADLPAHIAAQRQDVLTRLPIKYAMQAYAYQLVSTAQRFLLIALVQEPRLADDLRQILLDELINAARFDHNVEDPAQFIQYVLGHLPSPLSHLARCQQEVIDLINHLPPQHNGSISQMDCGLAKEGS